MDGLAEWLYAIRCCTSSAESPRHFQELRFRFAHALATELTTATKGGSKVLGPALYGVCLTGTGPLYVGQTTQAERRLRALPIGESHHLANTFPPEVWDRVILISRRDVINLDFESAKSRHGLGGSTQIVPSASDSNSSCSNTRGRCSMPERRRRRVDGSMSTLHSHEAQER